MATTSEGILKCKNRRFYSCDGVPGYKKIDAPGNGLLELEIILYCLESLFVVSNVLNK